MLTDNIIKQRIRKLVHTYAKHSFKQSAYDGCFIRPSFKTDQYFVFYYRDLEIRYIKSVQIPKHLYNSQGWRSETKRFIKKSVSYIEFDNENSHFRFLCETIPTPTLMYINRLRKIV